MKILFKIALIIFSTGISIAQSQDPSFLYLNHIPTQDIQLNKGWRFHPGDDTSWAKSYFDDSLWQMVDLSNYPQYLPAFKTKNIGWFRTKLLLTPKFQPISL